MSQPTSKNPKWLDITSWILVVTIVIISFGFIIHTLTTENKKYEKVEKYIKENNIPATILYVQNKHIIVSTLPVEQDSIIKKMLEE